MTPIRSINSDVPAYKSSWLLPRYEWCTYLFFSVSISPVISVCPLFLIVNDSPFWCAIKMWERSFLLRVTIFFLGLPSLVTGTLHDFLHQWLAQSREVNTSYTYLWVLHDTFNKQNMAGCAAESGGRIGDLYAFPNVFIWLFHIDLSPFVILDVYLTIIRWNARENVS